MTVMTEPHFDTELVEVTTVMEAHGWFVLSNTNTQHYIESWGFWVFNAVDKLKEDAVHSIVYINAQLFEEKS